jgi:hypothetical protein
VTRPDLSLSHTLTILSTLRIPFGGDFYFERSQCLAPPDEDCVEVIRLLGFPAQQPPGGVFSHLQESNMSNASEMRGQELWISLTGRNLDDHDLIVMITRPPEGE